jgi:hypothetical protein
MSKYEPLTRFLQNQPGGEVRMSFAQIEQLIGFRLPATAQHEPDWWSNSPAVDDVVTNPWLAAGFRSEDVDLAGGELTFRRNASADRSASVPSIEPRRHPIFGCMKGMMTIAPGVDLTEAADPDLADWVERKYGPAA